MSYARFRVNTPSVTHEIIDGEAVIINLDNGNYYSLVDSGADIWELIQQRTDVGHIVRAMAHRHHGDFVDIERGVHELISQLEQENLVIPDKSPASVETSALRDSGVDEKSKREFRTPALQKYTDMQELLLLDPIHDVDDMGWPRPVQEPDQ